MALYNESDDWQRFAREQMQNSAQNLQQKQAGLDAAKNQKTKTTLESALSGLVSGIGERISDIGNTAKNIGKTVVGGIGNSIQNLGLKQTQKDDSERRNEIAKKYGFNSYAEAINSDKVGDDFWNEIKQSNAKTKENLETWAGVNKKGSIGDVTDVNTNEAKGQALNTIDSVLGLLPGGAGVVANVAGGGISGVGDEYKAAGREGRDVDWSNAGKNALVGMASGTAGTLGGSAVGKVAGKLGGSTVGKLVGSNVAKGTIGGAASGAVGGAVGTALNGGTLEDALLAAKEGAKAGAIGGGVMAGTMGLGGTALDKIRNRGTTAQTIEPVDAQIVQKNRVEAPTAERIPSTVEAVEPVSNRRGIAITDLDAGEQPVRVKTTRRGSAQTNGYQDTSELGNLFGKATSQDDIADYGLYGKSNAMGANGIGELYGGEQPVNARNARQTANRGKYIDGVVRGKNLPEAEAPKGKTFADLGEGANLTEAINNRNSLFGGEDGYQYMQYMLENSPELKERVKVATRDYANEFDNPYAAYGQYGISKQSDLPTLNREQYYDYISGQLKKNGGALSAEDIPSYMQNHLRENDGNPLHNRNNDVILNEIFGDDMSLQDQYALYDEIAQVRPNSKYTTDNMAKALYLDDDLRTAVENQLVAESFPTNPARKINIESALTQTQPVDITDLTTNYRRSTIPARQYEQAVKAMPEAEVVANRPTTPQIAPEAEAGTTATGWGDKNMTNASKKRNILQRAGETLQETGQATKDSQVYSKLKGNTAEEMARKNSVQRLRDLGFNSTDYDRAANLSEVVNKYYDDAVKATKTPIEAPQLRNIANEIADDLRISSDNRADLIKNLNSMLDDAVARDGKMSEYTMDRYTPADLEKVAKKLGVMEQNLTTTNQGGSKKKIRNLRPEVEEYARALGEARNRLRNEIGEMADYDGKELAARMKDAGATQKQIDYVTKGGTLRSAKAATSLFEDARTMADQIKADAYKRGANATNSTNFATQVANASGASNLVNMAARPVANVIGTIEKGAGKVISGIGNKLAGTAGENAGETAGRLANGAKNLAGKAAGIANNAAANLNNESLANLSLAGMNTLGNQAQQFANKQMGKAEAERSQNRLENAQAVANAQADYDNALADYNAQEANYNANMATVQNQATGASQLDRIAAAMEMALNAGDITAYSQLADLYTQAAKIEELRNPTSNKTEKALSANQAKALTAQQQLEALAQMSPDAGTVASGIPLLGNIVNLTGGNEYANQASSLATTLGYLLSGANIKESEAQRIGQAYVPTAFDSEAVRKQKLERAKQLIQSYMSDTGALEA